MILTPKIVSRFLELSDPGKTANGYFHPSSIYFLLRLDIYLYRPPSHVDICEFIFISFLRKDNGPVSAKSEDVWKMNMWDKIGGSKCDTAVCFLQPSPIIRENSKNIEMNLKITSIVLRVREKLLKANFVQNTNRDFVTFWAGNLVFEIDVGK